MLHKKNSKIMKSLKQNKNLFFLIEFEIFQIFNSKGAVKSQELCSYLAGLGRQFHNYCIEISFQLWILNFSFRNFFQIKTLIMFFSICQNVSINF